MVEGDALMASLTTNFDADEFENVSDRPLLAPDLVKARQLAGKLETIRATFGVPLILTSYIRTGATTASGKRSQHSTGDAIDFEPIWSGDLNPRTWFDRVSTLGKSGALGDFDQLIFYPFSDDHTHLSLGSRRQILIANAEETQYGPPTPDVVARIPGSVVASAGGLLLVGAAFLFLNPKRGR
jgi:hypothetical protein